MGKKEEITRAVNAVFGFVNLNKTKGDILYYQEIVDHGGFEREHVSWGSFIKRLRKQMLFELGFAIRAERGVGYRLLTDFEQVKECSRDRSSRIMRQAQKGADEVSAANESQLSDRLKFAKAMQAEGFRREEEEKRRRLKEIEKIGEPSVESMPRVDLREIWGDSP